MRRSWDRIVKWYRKNTPHGTFSLAKGVSERTMTAFEKKLGILLPQDVRESFMLHNGTNGLWLLCFGQLMPLKSINQMWERYNEWQRTKSYGLGPDWKTQAQTECIKPIWWNPLRIPITNNGGGDPIFIDLDPGAGGRRGQIIKYNHETGPEFVLADSFTNWLKQIATDLQDDKYVYIKDAKTVGPTR